MGERDILYELGQRRPELSELADQLRDAKLSEEAARWHRVSIEEKIAALVEGPERGQKTVTLPDGRKVTVERGYNYKADCKAIEDALFHTGLPPLVKIKTTRELDVAGWEWYREHEQAMFAKLSPHVSVTPKKVSVQVKVPK